jgi:hypothetical protein
VVIAKGVLYVVMVRAECGWLWHASKIDNRMEVVPAGCLSEFAKGKVKGMGAVRWMRWWPLHCVIYFHE